MKSSLYKIEKKFLEQDGIVGYKQIKENHIAIIFPSVSKKIFPSIKSKEISLLTEHYTKNNENYRLYFCYNTDDFVNLVKSQYVYGLHIFGHGSIDHLVFEDGVVQYREFKNTQQKEFVAQWHCNHGDYEPLGYYIGKKYYAPFGYRNYFNNLKDIKKLINNQLIWEINNFS